MKFIELSCEPSETFSLSIHSWNDKEMRTEKCLNPSIETHTGNGV